MLIFKQNKPESNILLIIFFYLVLTLNVRASDLKVAAPDAYTSLTLETIETADEFDIVKLWKGININPKSEYEFSFVHGEKIVSCRLLQKSTNFMESFPKEILDCIEVSDVGESIINYGAFTLNESISGDDEKIFTFIYSNSYGFKFNKKEHPYLFIERGSFVDQGKKSIWKFFFIFGSEILKFFLWNSSKIGMLSTS